MERTVSQDLIENWLSEPMAMPEIIVNANELSDYSFSVINQGRWYPVAVGQDQYELRTGEGVNSAPWTDRNGRPVLISLYTLSTNLSNQGDANR